MINVRGLQRNVKNVVKNYTEAQIKVREATSNDPWGPSSTLMSEIADLTYNVVAFSEIMQMIWKRLNDHGKNWRHVYKALVLLEYLIKTGSEKVAQQCRENIFFIQTLKDFQHIEENKDQGMNVREKSKSLVSLLKDEEKLKNERIRALKAKERFAQSTSLMNNSSSPETIPKTSASYHESLSSVSPTGEVGKPLASDLESSRPQTKGEEELQLQLALAMSKEEAEQEERLRKNDEIRFQLALNESQKEKAPIKKTAMDDLLSININSKTNDPWGTSLNEPLDTLSATASANLSANNDPWRTSPKELATATASSNNDPWNNQSLRKSNETNDPWKPSPPVTPMHFDLWSSEPSNSSNTRSPGMIIIKSTNILTKLTLIQ